MPFFPRDLKMLQSLLFFFGSSFIPVVLGSGSPFSIVIDGGSTGSRLHIFEFVMKGGNVDCLRRGSKKVEGPLSMFARLSDELEDPIDPFAVASHFMPAFAHAARTIPKEYHASTRVWYGATAGMRLLSESEQDAIYDALYEGLLGTPDFVFRGIRRDDIGTLSGELEGFYGAVAANYLKGTINAKLEFDLIDASKENINAGPIGALDMGGASTQIVFLPQNHGHSSSEDVETCFADKGSTGCGQRVDEHMDGSKWFTNSYLNYGADQFRERLWDTWVEDRKMNMENEEGDACCSELLENPCGFRGHLVDWEGFTFVGTGDSLECVRQVQRLIPHPTEEILENLGSHVGGVEHPPVQGKFFAMSLYFFGLDCLRELSTNNRTARAALNRSWPNPSLQELHDALDGLCSRTWENDLEHIQHSAHAFTRAESLPHRCLDAVYMVTLLRDGFGFSADSRDITFTFLVDGSEVEWSLGMALSLRLEEESMKALKKGGNSKSDNSTKKSQTTDEDIATKSEEKEKFDLYGSSNGTQPEVDQFLTTMS